MHLYRHLNKKYHFSGMPETSGDNRFEILFFSKDDDSYFYSNSREEWHVRSIETGDELHYFTGSIDSDSSGTRTRGIERVFFKDKYVVTVDYSGEEKKYALPEKIEIVNGGKSLDLLYKNGKKERMERRHVVHTSKYGEPNIYPLKM